MTALCLRSLAALRPLYWVAIAISLTFASRAIADDMIVVHLDEATVIKLQSYGATNIIIMDKAGAVLTEHTVEVQNSTDKTVVVYRGGARETYSCTPECSARIALGDDTKFFTDVLSRMAARNSQSVAAGAGAPH
jgi:hypothetical protein